jgi:hypothetical protein
MANRKYDEKKSMCKKWGKKEKYTLAVFRS